MVWQKMYGRSNVEAAHSIQQTSDGGYIATGSSKTNEIPGVKNNGSTDYYILKLDQNGELKQ